MAPKVRQVRWWHRVVSLHWVWPNWAQVVTLVVAATLENIAAAGSCLFTVARRDAQARLSIEELEFDKPPSSPGKQANAKTAAHHQRWLPQFQSSTPS